MRLSILFGASQLGEKMPILIIGKNKNLRPFNNKNLESMGVINFLQ
jgi:hypothetical protein